ncbi:MAG TPA: hypothetical protein VGP89_18160 [Candidatus Angelobacter sp.]|nr:hypothetical protein [Candidatus Angelobacter sp.]
MSDYKDLTLAKGMGLIIGRIGYPDEGIRFTVHQGSPFNFNSELQLSRSDAEWVVATLRKQLDDPNQSNFPE